MSDVKRYQLGWDPSADRGEGAAAMVESAAVKRYYGWKNGMNRVQHEQVKFDEFVNASDYDALAAKLAILPADWEIDCSLKTWFPLTAEELERLRSEIAGYKVFQGELFAERDDLRKRLAEVEKDAARYRWLRSREWAVYALEYGCTDGIEYRDQPEDTLDATIDSALSQEATRG